MENKKINFLDEKEYIKAIEFAVIESNKEIIELLLNKGADINKQYINGNTVLHEAIKK